MKSLFLILVGLAITGFAQVKPDELISEKKAEEIVFSLPEVIKLKRDFQGKEDELAFDGPILEDADVYSPSQLGKKVWRLDVYQTVHDGPTMAHYAPWAFFVVSARTGVVMIRKPDWTPTNETGWVYLSLAEWRRQRTETAQQPPPLANTKASDQSLH